MRHDKLNLAAPKPRHKELIQPIVSILERYGAQPEDVKWLNEWYQRDDHRGLPAQPESLETILRLTQAVVALSTDPAVAESEKGELVEACKGLLPKRIWLGRDSTTPTNTVFLLLYLLNSLRSTTEKGNSET